MTFEEGDRVRLLKNPFDATINLEPGAIGTITADGDVIVGIRFGDLSVERWPVVIADGAPTIDLIDGVECAWCDEVVSHKEAESTPRGSMHGQCAHEFEKESPEEW